VGTANFTENFDRQIKSEIFSFIQKMTQIEKELQAGSFVENIDTL
jgi:hypothetical protein